MATWLAYSHPDTLPYLGAMAVCIAIGFATIYLGGLRTTGPEVFGDRIWWNDVRPIHAILYGLFAYYALKKSPHAWTFLATDVVLGAVAWILFHFFK